MQRGRQSAWKSTLTQHEHPCVAAGFLLQGCKLLCQSVWCWGGIPSGRSLAVVVSAGLNSPAKCFPLGCSVWHGELELMLSHSSITDLALEEQMSSRSKTSALPPGMGLAHTCYIHTHKKKKPTQQQDFALNVHECLGLPGRFLKPSAQLNQFWERSWYFQGRARTTSWAVHALGVGVLGDMEQCAACPTSCLPSRNRA